MALLELAFIGFEMVGRRPLWIETAMLLAKYARSLNCFVRKGFLSCSYQGQYFVYRTLVLTLTLRHLKVAVLDQEYL